MLANLVKFFSSVLLLLLSPNLARAVVIPAGLNPGDQYHLVFVTDGTRDATATTIGPYNTFVQNQAALNTSLTGTDQGVDWFVIGSTLNTNARDNALVGMGVPVYLLDGTTKIADGFGDLWDGDIDSSINIDQFGATVAGAVVIHTGTDTAGFTSSVTPPRYLGSIETVSTGRTDLATAGWIADGGAGLPGTARPFYALSERLTVPIPEPSTIVLVMLISCGMGALVLRKNLG